MNPNSNPLNMPAPKSLIRFRFDRAIYDRKFSIRIQFRYGLAIETHVHSTNWDDSKIKAATGFYRYLLLRNVFIEAIQLRTPRAYGDHLAGQPPMIHRAPFLDDFIVKAMAGEYL